MLLNLPWTPTAGSSSSSGGAVTANFTNITRTTTQSINSGANTAISFATVITNAAAVWAVGTPTRFTVPAGQGGKWHFLLGVGFAANATGARTIYFNKNGAAVDVNASHNATSASAGADTRMLISYDAELVAGDYIEVLAFQNSGGALNIQGADMKCYRTS